MKPSEIGLRRALDVHSHTLRNGLKVLLVDNSSVPTVSLTSSVLTGARYDLESKAGLAIMASRLLDEGTENRSASEAPAGITCDRRLCQNLPAHAIVRHQPNPPLAQLFSVEREFDQALTGLVLDQITADRAKHRP